LTAHRVRPKLRRERYFDFFAHFLSVACHIPPAFSQSAWVVIFERSPDGLAAGDELDPLPEVLVPEPLAPGVVGALPPEVVVPDDFDEPALPDVLVVPDCAAAIAGANAMTATTRAMTSFCILASSDSRTDSDNAGRRPAIFGPRLQAGDESTYDSPRALPWNGEGEIRGIFFRSN
jgi:hypothetical protein